MHCFIYFPQELKSNKLNNNLKKQLNTERRCHTHSLFYAYQGMILYFEWKQLIEKDDYDEGTINITYFYLPVSTF